MTDEPSTIPKRKLNMQFVGAAQQSYDSFMELARAMLDTFCINWNNTSDPASYIFPPTFPFINPDMSDGDIDSKTKDFEDIKKQGGAPQATLSSMERPLIDRWSDQGEFIVFQAIWTLVQEKIRAPFLAVHGLTLGNLKYYLQDIFPDSRTPFEIKEKFEAMMREFDFVLIGPNIGIIVIEVKSSAFTKQKDFAAKNRNLPDHIVDGVKQLQSFDPEFFQACSGTEAPPVVRRVLFTPNLEKSRFDDWYNNLDESAKSKVGSRLIDSGIIHWFKEDLTNSDCDTSKPDLYGRLREIIDAVGFQIPREIYEPYGLVISGLASALVSPNQPVVKLCTEQLSTSGAILRDADALGSQDPLQKLQLLSSSSTKSKRQNSDINPNDVVQLSSKLVLLTPEQQKALNGPNRQVIIGPPGTGKTIILQAKALQLLKDGNRVLIYTTSCYEEKYQRLFKDHGFTMYETSEHYTLDKTYYLVEDFFTKWSGTESAWKFLEIPEYVRTDEMRKLLTDYDAVLIDDAFDGYEEPFDEIRSRRLSLVFLLLAIARTSCKFRSKVIWVACDICIPDEDTFSRRMIDHIIRGEQQDYFAYTILNRAMRSSESVFHATYSQEILPFLAVKPELGHKIYGFSESVHLHNLPADADGRNLVICQHAESAVKKFREEGFDYGQMAIIVGGKEDVDLRFYLVDKLHDWKKIPVSLAKEDKSSSLTVDIWNAVSSLEWPVVIYIAMLYSSLQDTDEAYRRYRACSRATMKIFEIIAYQVTKADVHSLQSGTSMEESLELVMNFF